MRTPRSVTGAFGVSRGSEDYSAFLARVVFGAAFSAAGLAVAFGAALVVVALGAAFVVVLAAAVLVAVVLAAAFGAAFGAALRGLRGRGLDGRRGGRRGLRAGGLGQRGASLAGGGLGALGLDGLAGGDAGLGGLRRGGLAGGLGDVAGAHDGRAHDGGVDLLREAALAARGGVRVDRAALRGAVEGRDGLAQRGRDIGALGLGGGDRDGLGDEGLRRGPAGLQDGVPALSLADALQPGRVASALPFPGRSSQGG